MENIQYLTNILSYHLQHLHHHSYSAVSIDFAYPQCIHLRPALINRKAKSILNIKVALRIIRFIKNRQVL